MNLILSLFRLFFYLLYHQFAWTYDAVAAAVSLGRWKDWVRCALPYLEGSVLELGHGPGHLQVFLNQRGQRTFGLDESRQMSRQARRHLIRRGFQVNLTTGYAQHLPFADQAFQSVAATFPSEYIYEKQTLAEILRVLAPGGRLVILPAAWITGQGILDRLAAWLFLVTGQAGALDALLKATRQRLGAAGFLVQHELVEVRNSRVLVIIATPMR
jgi:ubiquinone/menaquinone biosynthesis C-methylase UbiE